MRIYRMESRWRRHLQNYTKVITRKLGEQNGLDTRVVQAVNYVYGYSYLPLGYPIEQKSVFALLDQNRHASQGISAGIRLPNKSPDDTVATL